MQKPAKYEVNREEMLELCMAITGLEKLVERYIEDFPLASKLLAVTEILDSKRQVLIGLDPSLLYLRK
jgi:hypothetical protein